MGYNSSTMDIGDDIPVNQVKIFEAMIFCNMISERDGLFPAYKLSKIVVVCCIRWKQINGI